MLQRSCSDHGPTPQEPLFFSKLRTRQPATYLETLKSGVSVHDINKKQKKQAQQEKKARTQTIIRASIILIAIKNNENDNDNTNGNNQR